MDNVTDSLWITDIHGVQQESTARFDAIITICQDSVGANVNPDAYHHFPLSDGPPPTDAYNPGEFSFDVFETAVDTILNHITSGDVTLVHCHAGQSRSVMAIAAAIAVLEHRPLDEAVDIVSQARTRGISPSPAVEDLAQMYVDAATSEAETGSDS